MENSDIKWVTEKEILQLRKGAKKTRYPVRNELIILMLYRHGLRESELCNLRLEQLDFDQAILHLKRLKGSNSFSHPIAGDELRLIRRYIRTKVAKQGSHLPWLFISERGNQLSRFTVIKILDSCRIEAKFTKKITPHMLRHGCGYYLANKGVNLRVIQDYLGHKNIQNTILYTRLNGEKFNHIWNT